MLNKRYKNMNPKSDESYENGNEISRDPNYNSYITTIYNLLHTYYVIPYNKKNEIIRSLKVIIKCDTPTKIYSFMKIIMENIFARNNVIEDNQKTIGKANSLIKYISENFKNFRPSRILDIGGGEGLITTELKKYYNITKNNTIIIDPKVRDSEEYTVLNSTDSIEFASIDLIIFRATLHHLDDKTIKNFLKECSRLISKNGIIIINEHNYFENSIPKKNSENKFYVNFITMYHDFWYLYKNETQDLLNLKSKQQFENLFKIYNFDSIEADTQSKIQRSYNQIFIPINYEENKYTIIDKEIFNGLVNAHLPQNSIERYLSMISYDKLRDKDQNPFVITTYDSLKKLKEVKLTKNFTYAISIEPEKVIENDRLIFNIKAGTKMMFEVTTFMLLSFLYAFVINKLDFPRMYEIINTDNYYSRKLIDCNEFINKHKDYFISYNPSEINRKDFFYKGYKFLSNIKQYSKTEYANGIVMFENYTNEIKS